MAENLATRACETCRTRRVKCDRNLPGCQRCAKFGSTCSGYRTERKFFDDGAKIRQKFNVEPKGSSLQSSRQRESSSANASSTPDAPYALLIPAVISQGSQSAAPSASDPKTHAPGSTPAQSLYSGESTSTGQPQTKHYDAHQAVLHGGFCSSAEAQPILNDGGCFTQSTRVAQNPEIVTFATLLGHQPDLAFLEDFSIDTSVNGDFFDLDIGTYYANGNNACGFIPGVPAILSDVNEMEPDDLTGTRQSTPYWTPPVADRSTPADDLMSGGNAIDSRRFETALLLRHFVDVMAPWMDVFDLDAYFTRIIPLKASGNAMLRSAIAAVAAKRIAQTPKDLSGQDGVVSLMAALSYDVASGHKSIDWFYQAASHYDRGLTHLRCSLQRWANRMQDTSTSPAAGDDVHLRDRAGASKRRRLAPKRTEDTDLEDLLAAVSVLNLYESLDTDAPTALNPSQHSDGFQSLLQDAVRPPDRVGSGDNASALHPRRGGRAAFWNFAQYDIATAWANHTTTRLDPEQLDLFRVAGLPLPKSSDVSPSAMNYCGGLFEGLDAQREDVISYTLIWLTIKIVNFVAPHQQPYSEGHDLSLRPKIVESGSSSTKSSRSQTWHELFEFLDTWHRELPMTFEPYASVPLDPHEKSENLDFSKLFFSIPLCAAALQLFHFAKILLILNQPMLQGDGNPAKRLRAFRNASEDSVFHSRQICGIALGRPSPSVQRQMVQSLYLAGLCFEAQIDQDVVLRVLRDIEASTGCSTRSQIEALEVEWG